MNCLRIFDPQTGKSYPIIAGAALTVFKTFSAGEVLTASDLNSSITNIHDNALTLISPLTGNLDFNANSLVGLALGSAGAPSLAFTGDTNTGVYSSGADAVNIAAGGSQAAAFGTQFILIAAPEDSRTNTVDIVGIIRSTTSGTPAAGIGVGVQFDAESADESPSIFGRLDFAAADVSAGSEDTYLDVRTRIAGATNAAIYRFQATAANRAIFTHANTADRTYTLPDATGTLSVGGHGPASVQTFTGNDTWTRPAGIVNVVVEVVSGGGGGGGSNTTDDRFGGGGGGGGYARLLTTAAGATETVTIGAAGTAGTATGAGGNGGTTSFGALVSATGGTGGPAGSAGAAGGAGGAGSSGDINLTGQAGGDSGTSTSASGEGGDPAGGFGQGARISSAQAAGRTGIAFGGGGSAGHRASPGASQAGGAGAAGIVVVWEYK